MDLRQYRHIVELADERHYARAAQSLGITQSALSRSIQACERELGIRLFDRGRNGVSVTKAGERLVHDARDLLMRARTVRENMVLLADCRMGDVAFGMGPLPAAMILADLLAHCATSHPGLRVRARQGSAEELLAWLKGGEVEFIVLSRMLIDPEVEDVSVKPIGSVKTGALVRKAHPLAGLEYDEKIWRGFPVIGGAPPQRPARDVAYDPTITCENYDVLRDVCLRTDAIWRTAECLARGGLVSVQYPGFGGQHILAGVSLANRTLSPGARMLMGEATRRFASLNRV